MNVCLCLTVHVCESVSVFVRVSLMENVCVWFGIVLLTLNVELIMVSQSMAGVWLVLVTMLHCSLLLCRDVESFVAAQHGLGVVLDSVLLAQEALPIVPVIMKMQYYKIDEVIRKCTRHDPNE